MECPPKPVSVVIRPPGRAPYTVTLDRLTAHVRAARELRMAINRDELKKKRLAAMGVVGSQMDASAAMYDEVVAYGAKVEQARHEARTAHLNALDVEISDLKQMAEDMSEFAQAAPPTSQAGTASGGAPITKPSAGSAALAALQAAVPKPADWKDGDAYVGTSPPNH